MKKILPLLFLLCCAAERPEPITVDLGEISKEDMIRSNVEIKIAEAVRESEISYEEFNYEFVRIALIRAPEAVIPKVDDIKAKIETRLERNRHSLQVFERTARILEQAGGSTSNELIEYYKQQIRSDEIALSNIDSHDLGWGKWQYREDLETYRYVFESDDDFGRRATSEFIIQTLLDGDYDIVNMISHFEAEELRSYR